MFTSMDFHMFFLCVGFFSASVLSNHVPFRLYLSPHPSQSLGKGKSDSLHMFQWNWAEIMAACHCYMYSKFNIYTHTHKKKHTNQFDFTDPTWRYICQVDWIDLAWPANIGTHPFAGTLKAAFSWCWNMLGSIPSLVWPTNLPSKFCPGTEVGRVGHFTISSGHLTLHLLPMLPSDAGSGHQVATRLGISPGYTIKRDWGDTRNIKKLICASIQYRSNHFVHNYLSIIVTNLLNPLKSWFRGCWLYGFSEPWRVLIMTGWGLLCQ